MLRQRSGKAGRRKELGAVGRRERRRNERDKRKENPQDLRLLQSLAGRQSPGKTGFTAV